VKNKYAAIVKEFKALSDENRIRILEMLQSGEKCACELLKELNVTQPTLSHHMKILCESGIVESCKQGKWTHYTLSKYGSEKVSRLLAEIITIKE